MGATFSSSSRTHSSWMSPPCRIISTPSKALKICGQSLGWASGMWVSEMRPMRMLRPYGRGFHHNSGRSGIAVRLALAERAAERQHARAQRLHGAGDVLGTAARAQLDVAPLPVLAHRGQAEGLDAGEGVIRLLHERR